MAKIPEQYSLEQLLNITAIKGKVSVRTQYACQVIKVSEDGRFVDLVHNTLEWAAGADGEKVLKNSYGRDVLCSPTKPWIVADIPVEQPYVRGQWKIRTRPKVGDRGILSVFYHDTRSLKEKGGFQAPDAIRVMAIDSASFRPGLPNHADVNAEGTTYPSDDEWELVGNGVSVKMTSPVDGDSESPNKMEVNVGSVSFTINVPQSGDPTVTFNIPDGTINVNAKTANITATTTTVDGNLAVTGDITATGEITGNEVTANGIPLSTHIHTGGTIPDPVTGVPTYTGDPMVPPTSA